MSKLDSNAIHADRTARLLQSAGDGIELIMSGLRAAVAESGEVPEDVEFAIGRVIRAACELRNLASTMEGRGE